MSAQYDLVVDQGSTLRVDLTWKDSNGVPIDITGYSVRFQIRRFVTASSILVDFDSTALAPGQTLAPLGALGVVSFELSDEITFSLPGGIHVWDIFLESPTGVRDRLVWGQVFVNEAVTRD